MARPASREHGTQPSPISTTRTTSRSPACPRLGVVRLRNAAPVPSAPSTSRLGCA